MKKPIASHLAQAKHLHVDLLRLAENLPIGLLQQRRVLAAAKALLETVVNDLQIAAQDEAFEKGAHAPNAASLVEAVKAHARKHFESRGAWDYVIETMDDAQILRLIGREETEEMAIINVGAYLEMTYPNRYTDEESF